MHYSTRSFPFARCKPIVPLVLKETNFRRTFSRGFRIAAPFRWPFVCIPILHAPSLTNALKARPSARSPRLPRYITQAILLFVLTLSQAACGGGSGAGAAPPSPPQIMVAIARNSGSVLLGDSLPFSATVTNTSDTSVFWSVNGISGGSPQVGTISPDGLFTAPADLPSGGKLQITTTSHADPTKSSTAGVTISSDFTVSLSAGSTSVELGALQSFQASITSNGKPDPALRWSLSGSACPNNCGAVGPTEVPNAIVSLCRNSTNDPGWPPLQSCVVPSPNLEFTTATRTSP